MYLREGREAEVVITPSLRFVAGLALVVTLALGLYPPPLLRQAAQSAAQIVRQSAVTQHAGR
jgi:NADH:ubiquinone oxidoreductase subunit 4 (subunit M)